MTYTEQAAKRTHCFRLSAFIRLVDYLVATTLHSIAVTSTQALRDHLKHIIDRTNEIEAALLKQAEEEAARAAEAERLAAEKVLLTF